MLVLSRRVDESIVIRLDPHDKSRDIYLTIVDIRHDRTKVGFEAPSDILILRSELDKDTPNAG